MGNIIALGERTLYGKYGRVLAAGELHIEDSDISKIYGAGEITLINSIVRKIRIAGEIEADKCTLLDVNMVGDISLKGHTKAQQMVIRGVLNSEYLECDHFILAGKTDEVKVDLKYSTKSREDNPLVNVDISKEWSQIIGFVKTKVFENYSKLIIDFDQEIIHLINMEELYTKGAIECERVYSSGIIKCEEINADYIMVKAMAESSVRHIVGSRIILTNQLKGEKGIGKSSKKRFEKYYNKWKKKMASIMSVESIEGDQIAVDHVKAELVSGMNVTIGELCIIDRVEYRDKIEISPKAVVGEVVKL